MNKVTFQDRGGNELRQIDNARLPVVESLECLDAEGIVAEENSVCSAVVSSSNIPVPFVADVPVVKITRNKGFVKIEAEQIISTNFPIANDLTFSINILDSNDQVMRVQAKPRLYGNKFKLVHYMPSSCSTTPSVLVPPHPLVEGEYRCHIDVLDKNLKLLTSSKAKVVYLDLFLDSQLSIDGSGEVCNKGHELLNPLMRIDGSGELTAETLGEVLPESLSYKNVGDEFHIEATFAPQHNGRMAVLYLVYNESWIHYLPEITWFNPTDVMSFFWWYEDVTIVDNKATFVMEHDWLWCELETSLAVTVFGIGAVDNTPPLDHILAVSLTRSDLYRFVKELSGRNTKIVIMLDGALITPESIHCASPFAIQSRCWWGEDFALLNPGFTWWPTRAYHPMLDEHIWHIRYLDHRRFMIINSASMGALERSNEIKQCCGGGCGSCHNTYNPLIFDAVPDATKPSQIWVFDFPVSGGARKVIRGDNNSPYHLGLFPWDENTRMQNIHDDVARCVCAGMTLFELSNRDLEE